MKGFKSKRTIHPNRHEDVIHMDKTSKDKQTVRERLLHLFKSKKWLTMSAAGALVAGVIIFAGIQIVQSKMVSFYHVYINGAEVGTINDQSQLTELYKLKQQSLAKQYPNAEMVLQTDNITTSADRKYKAVVDAKSTLKKVEGALTGYARGVELKVNGKTVGIVKNQETADYILNQVEQSYVPAGKIASPTLKTVSTSAGDGGKRKQPPQRKLESVTFSEQINVVPVETDPHNIINPEDAVKMLTTDQATPIIYEVREGDTISSIAKKYNLSEKQIYKNNPGVQELYLQIGDELNLTVPKPLLTLKTVEIVTEEIVTEPKIVVRKSDSLRSGQSKVISEGNSGLKRMEYRITKENGDVVSEEWLGHEVLKQSTPTVVMKGTKIVGVGSGDFAWPVVHAIMSSSYGTRWGRMHKGVDLVSSNRSILAADEGVVTFAGVKHGYGNTIVINHRNGYETLYGHLSSIRVNVGDIVEQGSKIGIMGSTGHSTGTHLHFEIHKNSVVQNPMKYLE
ncbi:M23 family metallopeptidase [Paenibacillus sediminis]|uniref:Murein DD-endopeptidase MepM/ murein hydrolase activator NlpD n=1 Tax=Paenibacillus sediminis TaxID=664909 RepID=A0ABS4H6T2_9BACL|nr:M23 family metallopeptidase [Paenibacillus sediminis]MBP1938237.1 murein DD-endopeptidase MepM/ murein hydrolase activator NlpD [Paenibacillus sediminis]